MKRISELLETFHDTFSASASFKSLFDKKKVVAAEQTLTYHIVKHYLFYKSMDWTIKLNENIYVSFRIHKARTKIKVLVKELLGPYSIEDIRDVINRGNLFYYLQTDASSKKNKKLFSLVIQYFTDKNVIQNKVLDFHEKKQRICCCDVGVIGAIEVIFP